ncbi:secondary metabolite protein [Streptomyces sp. AJS327]|uniref:secondary metabolite protein n=1 Tax=Streptomyces sp. AJS327 TaxID=2545265 RepID=UPI0015DF5F19|nr:secondary metabolite protein [Streptomyces sp. AJS327]MBA0053670.1 secondary metabolite protein [Streptomyces sp. AJS327]
MFRRRRNDAYRRREEELRSMCQRELDGIRLPQRDFTIEEFCTRLSELRGRRLVLRELPDSGGVNAPCGLWVSFAETDVIFHAAGTSERHREQIIRHELAHMLLGHRVATDTAALVREFPAHIDPEAVRRVFGRVAYDSERERDAELAAMILQELIAELPTDIENVHQKVATSLDDVLTHPFRTGGPAK